MWTSPSGWSIYTSVGNTAADSLADCIATAAAVHLPSMKLRGVLTENGFMTNEQECRWLQTRAAKQAIVDLHVEGITEYLAG